MEQIGHGDKQNSGISSFVTFVSLNSFSLLFPSVPLHVLQKLSLFSLWLSTLFFLALTLPRLTDMGCADLREATPAM